MKKLIFALSFFAVGFLINNYYFKRAWTVERLIEASAMQAKMSYIRGCVETNKVQTPGGTSYGDCEIKSQQTYKDVFEILTKNPDKLFTVKRSKQ